LLHFYFVLCDGPNLERTPLNESNDDAQVSEVNKKEVKCNHTDEDAKKSFESKSTFFNNILWKKQ